MMAINLFFMDVLESIMPYIFGLLVLINMAFFGYSWFVPKQDLGTLEQTKSQLERPLNYQNSTHAIPPLVGQK